MATFLDRREDFGRGFDPGGANVRGPPTVRQGEIRDATAIYRPGARLPACDHPLRARAVPCLDSVARLTAEYRRVKHAGCVRPNHACVSRCRAQTQCAAIDRRQRLLLGRPEKSAPLSWRAAGWAGRASAADPPACGASWCAPGSRRSAGRLPRAAGAGGAVAAGCAAGTDSAAGACRAAGAGRMTGAGCADGAGCAACIVPRVSRR